MLVLGIETSCDETGLAVLDVSPDNKVKVVSEVLASQIKLHQEYGGVVPELASREHLKSLPFLFQQVLEQAQLQAQDLSGIGVTQGPGLKGCLLMGFHFAKAIALAADIPIVGVNHIEGHVFAPGITNELPEFPFLALIVSGGHTEIQLVHDFGNYELLARTIDDAAGEAFDKSAQLLGFDYPGGAALSAFAKNISSSDFTLPKVMREADGFSFSGLKTAISLLIKANPSPDEGTKAELCHAIEQSIVESLVFKLKKAIKKTGIRRVVLTGGVAANGTLRAAISELSGVTLTCPPAKYCTDNGAMIAYVAARRLKNKQLLPVDASTFARWPLEMLSL